MERQLAIVLLLTATLAVLSQAAVKDIPPLFHENPNQRFVAENAADETDVNYRLPNNTVPLEYDVYITTNVHSGDLNFTGVLKLTLSATEDTRTIVLHSRRTTINSATVQSASGTGAAIRMTYTYETAREFLTLTPEDTTVTMQKDTQWILTINYNGTLRQDNGGFYVSTYLDENKQTRYLATTQFESTDARHAFPCYDEPAKRAKFGITINHDATYGAISNMPIKEQTTSNGRNTTIFQVTPSMPSYLVAFIVSDFKWTEAVLNNLPQRVFTRPGSEGDQEFSLVAGLLIEARLADYYGVPFALPKLDQVGVPDFSAGAMENWGLATYREQYMLYNKDKSTVNTQTSIANIIAHEYAHQWFGNIVCIEWWGYLWLKEGFATMFSYKASDEAYPEWGVTQLYHTGDYQSALNNDASNNPRPMTHYVQKPNEISGLYDTVSYAKAGSVLFMWQYALTDKVFQRGLHNYLETNKFSSANQDDLFEAIRIAAKEENFVTPATIKDMMSTWTNQGGYPVLTVERSYGDGSFKVTQEAFYNDDTFKQNKTWYVPFNYAVSSNSDFRDTKATHYLLNVPSIQINDKISNDDWLILNKQSTGYYRINYDERNWNLIIDGLIAKPQKIHPRSRAQLLHDAYRFSSSNRLNHGILLNMMAYLKAEDQYAPWSTANSILTTFNKYLSGDKYYADFKFFVTALVSNIYNKLGVNDIPGEHHLDKYIRSIAMNLACMAGIQSCLEDSNNKLKGSINDNITIEPNLVSQTYCNGLKQSGDNEFDFIFKKLMTSEDQALRRTLISSLGCSQTQSQIQKFISSSISEDADNTLRVQERTTLLNAAFSQGEPGLLACIDFLDQNWQKYAALTGGFDGNNPLDSDILAMSTWVTNSDQEAKLLALVTKVKDSPFVRKNLEEIVKSRIQTNFDWLTRNRDPLMNWMTTYRTGGSATISASIMSVFVACTVILMRLV